MIIGASVFSALYVGGTCVELPAMMKRMLVSRSFILLILTLLVAAPAVVAQPAPTAGERYAPLFFPVEIDPGLYRNPFDPTDIELLGIFESPGGERLVIPGYWMQPYTDDLEPRGDGPVWGVRFTPREAGRWTYTLQVRDEGAIVSETAGAVDVAESDRRGFIRVGENGRYFRFDNGESYFPVGYNLGWAWDGNGGLDTYLRWLRELAANGGNYVRLNIDVPWFINLEWVGPAGDYRGAWRQAAMLDMIIAEAEQLGIYLQLTLLWHQSLRIYNGPPVLIPENPPRPNLNQDWDTHPYNVVVGGPLSGPAAFFFDQRGGDLFRQRLRYIAARWGGSPHIFAWEIVDRLDRTTNYNPEIAGQWLRSMASYLRQVDPHGHLITAGAAEDETATADNPLLDFSLLEFYQRRPIETTGDQVMTVIDRLRTRRQINPAPTLLTSFSLNPWYEPTADDPEGVHVQTTLWSGVLSGAAGVPAGDWWDTYLIPQGITRHYAPLAAFTAGIDWARLDLQPAQAALSAEMGFAPVRLTEYNRQFLVRVPLVLTHEITPDGIFPPITELPSYLYGQIYNNQFSQVHRYRAAPPTDTYLEIAVRTVSAQAGARLVVMRDDEVALDLRMTANSRNIVVRIPLPAGEQIITLDNLGDDWLELDYLEFGALSAPARALSLRDSQAGVALAWLQHRDYTWEQVAAGVPREPLQLTYTLDRMPQGRYIAEIWDVMAGAVVGEEVIAVEDDGRLAIELLPLESQLALRIQRQREADESIIPIEPPAFATRPPAQTPTPSIFMTPIAVPQATTAP